MDKNTKISFIPKKPLVKEYNQRILSVNMMLLASLVFFFLTLTVHGGLYLYKTNLDKIIGEKEEKLVGEKERVDPLDIVDRAENLQKKITHVESLLNKHIAPSKMFDFLEEVTLKNIQLKSFNFNTESDIGSGGSNMSGDVTNGYFIKITGEAPSYSSLAYQSDVLTDEMKEGGRIKDFIISDIRLGEAGGVSFDVNIILHPSFFLYGVSAADFQDDKNTEVSVEENIILDNKNQ